MILASILIIIGITLLYIGGEYAVQASINIAKYWKISTAVIAGTIVAFGTSAPELAVSLTASLSGEDTVAIGNAFGSNIANILLALGLVFCVAIIKLRQQVSLDLVILNLIFHAIIIGVLYSTNILSLWLGGGLFIILLGHTIYQFLHKSEHDNEDIEVTSNNIITQLIIIILGIAGLVIGAYILVEGAVTIATILQIDQAIIALSVIALGTSLPEIFATFSAAKRGEHGFILGNIMGSCFFNLGMILGLSALVTNGLSANYALSHYDGLFLGAIVILLTFIIIALKQSNRWIGFLFLVLYTGYCLHLWWRITI